MGVAGLWPLLEPAQTVTTLTALSLTKFGATSRGFRIGIDASIWFFHAEYGKEGENPELRTLFFRCAQLLSQGFLPLFVFDGPLRPDIKRGKRINKSAHKLVTGMQAIIEAFGFEYRTAPGEAEAELAFLDRIGVIDGILSDDVDNFLFGAHTVVRNHSSTHAGAKSVIEKAKVFTYTLPHPSFPDIGREELIFIALCSGGDYGTGLDNCGIKISYGLARAGFGKSLCQAALNHDENSVELRDFLQQWKKQLAHELKTNASGFLPRKSPKLSSSIPESFPDIKVLLAYLKPVTSESLGRSERYDDLIVDLGGRDGWLKKDPSLPLLAEMCEFYFEWGFLESIIKRFRTIIFQGVVLRIMRRACILRQTGTCDTNTIDFDVIRSHFTNGTHIQHTESSCPVLIKDVSKTRKHESTSKTLEYRVAINPTVLVEFTTHGVKGNRRPDDKDEWAEFEEEVDDESSGNEGGLRGKSKKKEYPDSTLPLKLWLPAVLVKEAIPGMVEAYEDAQKRKEEKKAGKGRKERAAAVNSPRKPKLKSSAPAVTIKVKPTISQLTFRSAKDTVSSDDDDMEYDELFLPSYPAHSTTSPLPDLFSSDVPSSSTYSTSPPSDNRPASYPHGQDVRSSFDLFTLPANDKGKQKVGVSRAGSLLSTIDDIATPKRNKKAGAYQRSRFEPSSPRKTLQPFPVSLDNSFDNDSDDDPDYGEPFKFNSIHSPIPPGPPQTPSPQKKTRNAIAVSSSDSSASEHEDSPRKDKDGILNKSPRKSKGHRYPKGLEVVNGEWVRKTIRDIPHPSRVARAASPTPIRRTPVKSTHVNIMTKTVVSTRVSSVPPSLDSCSTSAPRPPPVATDLGPIIISDSDSDSDSRTVPLSKTAPPSPPKPKPRPRSKFKAATTSDVPKSRNHESRSSKPISDTLKGGRKGVFDEVKVDDDDIPPLLRARVRAKIVQPTSKAKIKTTLTTMITTRTKTVLDIIDLSDDSS
ncbi:hypothetical protein F5890DRAFT_1532113 [Lentinula detonsa]|uniref:PIN domain-like protein n=1 Tax=Lentinula detonsa TaxID=2804962 RepID=A0AA38PVG1_9AGAR|nr:hypothetical protein F5890DRAFT_1532113 [Lentinula detonsa]